MALERTTICSRYWVALAALLWATTGVAGVVAPAETTSAALAEARTLIGGLALAGVVLARNGTHAFRRLSTGSLVVPMLALASFQWSFFAGVRGAGAGIASVVSAAFAPFAGDVLAALRARHWPGLGFAVGAMLLTAATIMLALRTSGVAAAAVSGVAYAVYADAAARVSSGAPGSENSSSLALTAAALLGAAVALAPAAVSGVPALLTARGIVVTAYLGLIATGAAYAAFVHGLRGLSAADALAILFVQPLAAAALGWFVLGEPVDGELGLATAALLLAALLRSIPVSRPHTQENNP